MPQKASQKLGLHTNGGWEVVKRDWITVKKEWIAVKVVLVKLIGVNKVRHVTFEIL